MKAWLFYRLSLHSVIPGLILLLIMMSQESPGQMKTFLALGDSYTIGESVSESERWPVQLVQQLNKNGENYSSPTIIATTGWRTDDLQKAIAQANLRGSFDWVSLSIGVNNQYQGKSLDVYKVEFEELLNTAIALAGGNRHKVFIVSIPDYGFTPFGKDNQLEITKAINSFNQVNEQFAREYQIQYINITDLSREGLDRPELIAGDGLHPSGKMYALWVDKILGVLNP